MARAIYTLHALVAVGISDFGVNNRSDPWLWEWLTKQIQARSS